MDPSHQAATSKSVIRSKRITISLFKDRGWYRKRPKNRMSMICTCQMMTKMDQVFIQRTRKQAKTTIPIQRWIRNEVSHNINNNQCPLKNLESFPNFKRESGVKCTTFLRIYSDYRICPRTLALKGKMNNVNMLASIEGMRHSSLDLDQSMIYFMRTHHHHGVEVLLRDQFRNWKLVRSILSFQMYRYLTLKLKSDTT